MTNEAHPRDITAVLAEVASDVVGELALDRLLEKVLETTMRTLNAEVCSIFLRKKDNPNVIECVAGSGFAKKIVGIAEYRIGEGFTGSVALGEEFNIQNRDELQKLSTKNKWKGKFDKEQWSESGGKSQYRNGIAIPLKIKDQILGVIKVENKKECHDSLFFTETDKTIFKIIANVVALAVENAKSHQKTEEQSKVILQALSDVTSAVVGQLNRKELLDKIIETTMKTLDAEVCSIFLLTEDNLLKCVAGSGFAKNIVDIAEYTLGEGLTGVVAKEDTFIHIKSRFELEAKIKKGQWKGKYDDIQYKTPSKQEEFRNLLAYPLKIGNKLLGVIKVENKKGGDFTDQDVTVFQSIANVIALTIEKSFLIDKTNLQEQTEKLLKTISSKAAHRINNQVTNYDSIEVFLREEIKELLPSPNENILKLMDRLHNTTVGLKRLINELRSYGKPLQLKKEKVNINEIIQSEIEQFKADNHSIQINPTLDLNIPTSMLDGTRLSENIKELLRNSERAIKAANRPAGAVDICTKLGKNGKTIEIRIADNGSGIAKDFPIFIPFNSTHPQGTGLGLATVKETIEVHGGEIKLCEQENETGACFEITLPITEEK
ncbi:histidine kinase with GAF domain [Beggiatoa alba B18LD]|uniref:histidine kinase n=1 Tax=Beggiatoa alba B18LD TaxID=395493 RepID=I3CGT9_9GAMM|nr:GAF domain-containing sensor histidine kinase [Beggiatoa alba]EIJ42832.1 histidine kinase with GAF domain [Beggiatoa alba B18LD]